MRNFYLLSSLALIVLFLSACTETPVDGVNGLNTLIEVRDATTVECQYGGKAFVQGFDITGDGKIDNIASVTLNCNSAPAPVIAKIEPCGTCHQAANDALVPSPHLQRAFMDSYASYVGESCLTCHTGGIFPNVADFKSLNATSGLVCKSCHNKSGVGFGTMHASVGVNTLVTSGFVDLTMCANDTCHGNPPGHIGQGHPYPFADNISGAFKKATYEGATAGVPEADTTTFNVHGKTSNRATCTPCHAGGYLEAVVIGNPALERRATGAVVDGKTVWTTTGGASYLVENQRAKAFGASDNRTGFNYVASQKGFGTWNSTAANGGTFGPIDVVASKLTCTTCHDKHSTDLIGKEIKDNDGTVVFSKEFMTCTSCHVTNLDAVKNDNGIGYSYSLTAKYAPAVETLVDLSGTGAGPFKVPTLKSEDIAHHSNSFASGQRNLGISHFSGKAYTKYDVGSDKIDNVTIDLANKNIGIITLSSNFNINAAANNACTSCHDAHYSTKFVKSDNTTYPVSTIAKNWAQSKHAAYNNAAMIGRVDGYSSTCNRCHNGIAFAYSIGGVSGANLNKEAFKTTGSVMAQTISCVTCHDTEFGANPVLKKGFNQLALSADNATSARIRQWKSKGTVLTEINPAWVQDGLTKKTLADGSKQDLAVLATSKITVAAFGDKSMVCTQCHSGRNTGEMIVESVQAAGPYALGTPTTSRALTDYPHYMDAIGSINKNGPYNFAGKTYGKTINNSHTNNATVTCVTCHDVKQHTFKVFKDADGNYINASNPDLIKGYTATCAFNCHANASQTVLAVKGYNAAITQLKAQLAARGKFYNAVGATITGVRYPTYWVTAPDGTVGVTSWSSTDELGAAYNTLYFAKYDTAGWAHGMLYTKQVLFDSMQALGGTFTGDAALWIPSRP